MLKIHSVFVTIGFLLAATHPASADPETMEECLAATFEAAEKASQEKLSGGDLDTVTSLVERLERECSSEKFSEAGNTALEIRQILDRN